MKRNILTIHCIILLITGVFCATGNLYGVGYLLFIVVGGVLLPSFGVFGSLVSRIVLSGMLLLASIMFTGLVTWLIGQSVHPLMVLICHSLLTMLLAFNKSSRSKDKKFLLFDKADLVSIPLALLGPLILFSSFSTGAVPMYQIASEGWDNGSHMLMLQDAATYKKYLYGPAESLKSIVIQESNAYPQAWHLATANAVNGFGINVFDSKHEIRATYAYVGVAVAWMVIACYLFLRTSWFVFSKHSGRKSPTRSEIVIFLAVTSLIQMIVIWGSFVSGFSNYVGMLAYICITIAAILSMKQTTHGYNLALISASAAALCWFLPAPAIFASVLLTLPVILGVTSFKKGLRFVRTRPLSSILTVSLLSLCLVQIFVFVLFSSTAGGDQLNAGVNVDPTMPVIGVFHVSQLFFIAVAAFCLAYWTRSSVDSAMRNKFLVAVLPIMLLVIALYAYQTISSGSASYYLPKLSGVALIFLGIFTAGSLPFWIGSLRERLRLPHLMTPIVGLTVIGLVLIASNQSGFGAMKLLKQNTKISDPVATVVVDYLRNADHKKSNIVILRGINENEDRNGKFETRVVHQKLTCSYTVNAAAADTEMRIERLGKCADKLAKKGRSLVVITSGETKKEIEALMRPNITVKNVKEKKKE